ncbi:MAG: (Na+)-NQR maturation NqrM [Halioglobus sp.]
MTIFIITLFVFALVLAIMAVGVIMGGEPIKGSCGGMGALGIDQACDICGGDPQRCDEETRDGDVGKSNPGQFYPADKS